MIQLRPYQTQLVQAIRAAYAHSCRAPLLVLPTGGGKTVLFSYVTANAAARGRIVYLLAHRAELVRQIAMTLAKFGCYHDIIAPEPIRRQTTADEFRAFGRSFVSRLSPGRGGAAVASVQTLVRRLEKPGLPDPDIIVVDEAHHLTRESTWGRVVGHWPRAKIIAVTATPIRLDGCGLGRHAGGFADDIILGPSVRELIDAGMLSPFRVFAPPVALDLHGVRTRAGDYARDQLARAVNVPQITGDVVGHYQRLAAGKRAVVFCVSVSHAAHVAAAFRDAGISSASLDGTMDAGTRVRLVDDFSSGRIMVLTSCDIISEGFDLPAIEVAILLRPTQSLGLYLQQVGRALRTHPGKTEALILDHVGAVMTHGMPDEDREWTLDGCEKRERADNDNERITTCKKCFAVHRPAPACPVCGHVEPVRERTPQEVDGELVEVDTAAIDAARRQKRALQAQSRTVEELVASTGMSRWRAEKIVAAREAKRALQADVLDRLNRLREATGKPWSSSLGMHPGEFARLKPRELQALRDRADAALANIVNAA